MDNNQNWGNTIPGASMGHMTTNQPLMNFDDSAFQPAVMPRSMMSGQMDADGGNWGASGMASPVTNSGSRLDFPDFGTNTRMTNTDPSTHPETLRNPIYVPGYLKQMIGKMVRLELLIGNSMVTRTGRLAEVGASFVVLQMNDPRATMLCDLYSIKFVGIVNNMNDPMQNYGY